MLVSIMGSPCSGKTTVAAKVFAALKEQGFSSEFITEQARSYIAERKYNQQSQNLSLNDSDQVEIFERQYKQENFFSYSAHQNTVILCDSSSLNSILYMTPELAGTEFINRKILKSLKNINCIFYCKPLSTYDSEDVNRVHDQNFALELDKKILSFAESNNITFDGILHGTATERANQMLTTILSKMVNS
ncbi:NK domain containing protein [uncultured Caudovirales phage]|uniref:NK domain containing protein n=1 Tax=uncultured Caudovirales phage TaxID=2100421 RepID=A0A6J5L214_9CAUD|nr:NK domain containing protein [uncultured Caudovirales phage]